MARRCYSTLYVYGDPSVLATFIDSGTKFCKYVGERDNMPDYYFDIPHLLGDNKDNDIYCLDMPTKDKITYTQEGLCTFDLMVSRTAKHLWT